jgi:hypothetical protein
LTTYRSAVGLQAGRVGGNQSGFGCYKAGRHRETRLFLRWNSENRVLVSSYILDGFLARMALTSFFKTRIRSFLRAGTVIQCHHYKTVA